VPGVAALAVAAGAPAGAALIAAAAGGLASAAIG